MLNARERLAVRVVVVGFARWEALRGYQRRFGLEGAVVLSDEERRAYAAFGFGRASMRRVWLDPRVWSRYVALIARGRRPAPAHEDTLQLGGDVVVDADQRVRWIYRSEGPEDRPSLAAVAAAVRSLAASDPPHPGR